MSTYQFDSIVKVEWKTWTRCCLWPSCCWGGSLQVSFFYFYKSWWKC